ncbi:MAG: tetratricopeptide repeat protein [Alphaproteobacteria bacterium]|nr:tetratricopeptide repeat protein [Alphaproteobacteria bacterium]
MVPGSVIDDAYAQFEKGNWRAALNMFNGVNPADIDALTAERAARSARVLSAIGALSKAREFCEFGARLDSAHPEIIRERAMERLRKGDVTTAIEMLRKVLTEHPDYEDGSVLLAVALFQQDPKTGLDYAETHLAKLNSNAEALANLAAIQFQTGQIDKAEATARKAHARKDFLPGNLEVLIEIAKAKRDIDTVRGLTDHYYTCHPWSQGAVRRKVDLHMQLKDYETALALVDTAEKERTLPAETVAEVRAISKMKLGLYLDGAQDMFRFLQYRPNAEGSWDVLGQFLAGGDLKALSENCMSISTALNPGHGTYTYNLGVYFTMRGRNESAGAIADRLVLIEPESPRTFILASDVASRLGEADRAQELMERVPSESRGVAVLAQRAALLIQQERIKEAEPLLLEAIEADPTYYLAHSRLATVYVQSERQDEAIKHYEIAYDLKPDNKDLIVRIGKAYAEQANKKEAIKWYRRAVEEDPDSAFAVQSLAKVLIEFAEWEEADAVTSRLVELQPDAPMALVARGEVNLGMGNIADALHCFEHAYRKAPTSASLLDFIGAALKGQQYQALALAFFRRAKDLKYTKRRAFNCALFHLGIGEFGEGFDLYEMGFEVLRMARGEKRPFTMPWWDGEEDLSDKSVVLWPEQGVGDHLMFFSMAHEIIGRAKHVFIEAEYRMLPLIERSFPDAEVHCMRKVPPQVMQSADLQLPCASIARFLRRKVKDFSNQKKSFLTADPDRVAQLRERYRNPKKKWIVGIGWNGGKLAKRQELRSVPLRYWEPIFRHGDDIQFVSIQYGPVEPVIQDANKQHGIDIIYDPEIDPMTDLDASAAQIAACDLIISATNAGVHTAGGLGVPCWTMIPFVSDWRWTVGRDDALWYPGMRIFRKSNPRTWTDVVETVGGELGKLVAGDLSVLRHPNYDHDLKEQGVVMEEGVEESDLADLITAE